MLRQILAISKIIIMIFFLRKLFDDYNLFSIFLFMAFSCRVHKIDIKTTDYVHFGIN